MIAKAINQNNFVLVFSRSYFIYSVIHYEEWNQYILLVYWKEKALLDCHVN